MKNVPSSIAIRRPHTHTHRYSYTHLSQNSPTWFPPALCYFSPLSYFSSHFNFPPFLLSSHLFHNPAIATTAFYFQASVPVQREGSWERPCYHCWDSHSFFFCLPSTFPPFTLPSALPPFFVVRPPFCAFLSITSFTI